MQHFRNLSQPTYVTLRCCGCSTATIAVADISHYWNIPLVGGWVLASFPGLPTIQFCLQWLLLPCNTVSYPTKGEQVASTKTYFLFNTQNEEPSRGKVGEWVCHIKFHLILGSYSCHGTEYTPFRQHSWFWNRMFWPRVPWFCYKLAYCLFHMDSISRRGMTKTF